VLPLLLVVSCEEEYLIRLTGDQIALAIVDVREGVPATAVDLSGEHRDRRIARDSRVELLYPLILARRERNGRGYRHQLQQPASARKVVHSSILRSVSNREALGRSVEK